MRATPILITALVALAMAAAAILVVLRRERRAARDRGLTALREATARVVHQSRNPLQSILLHADLLGDGTAAGSEARAEHCRAIVTEAQRLSAVMGELVVFATGAADPASLQLVPLRDLLREMARTGTAGAVDLAVEAEVDGWVMADPYQLRRALGSVLANARDAVDDRDDGRIVARVAERAGRVVVEVSDNGDGIPPERIGSACDPFVSWRPGRMGLGLTTAREILERHGGRLHLRSEPGSGTTVRLTLPAA